VSREDIEARMVEYMLWMHAEEGLGWYGIARHMLGLRHGLPGARRWRQVWSDHRLKAEDPRHVMALAHQGAEAAARAIA
jgi:tRNA-dihydrouridine synthase A